MRRAVLAASVAALLLCADARAQSVNSPINYPPAASFSQVATPSGPGSTSSYTMQGLGKLLTPTTTGRVLVTVSGYTFNGTNVTAGAGIAYHINYGTGSAPVNGAAVTGTTINQTQASGNSTTTTSGDNIMPFSTTAFVTGLTIGTTYWFDIAAIANGSTGFTIQNPNVLAIEQ